MCSVDGETSALEIAHIIDWADSRDHAAEYLVLLCANCHTRAHKEKWGTRTLRYYRDHPTRGAWAGRPFPSFSRQTE
jgi:type I restriction enzyme R subunit